jgi:hypothetical protein
VGIETPHPIDLTVSKVLRGDDKDWAFARYTHQHFRVTEEAVVEGLRAIAQERPEYAAAAERAIALLPAKLAGGE